MNSPLIPLSLPDFWSLASKPRSRNSSQSVRTKSVKSIHFAIGITMRAVILLILVVLLLIVATSSETKPNHRMRKRQLGQGMSDSFGGFGAFAGPGGADRWINSGSFHPHHDREWGHRWNSDHRFHRCMRGCLRQEGLRHERRCERTCDYLRDDDDD